MSLEQVMAVLEDMGVKNPTTVTNSAGLNWNDFGKIAGIVATEMQAEFDKIAYAKIKHAIRTLNLVMCDGKPRSTRKIENVETRLVMGHEIHSIGFDFEKGEEAGYCARCSKYINTATGEDFYGAGER